MKALIAAALIFAAGTAHADKNVSDNPMVNLCGEKVPFKNIHSTVPGTTIGILIHDARSLDGVKRMVVCYQNGLAYMIAGTDTTENWALSVVAQ